MTRFGTLGIAGALVAITGCNNPFDPAADIKLIQISANSGQFESISQTLATSWSTSPGSAGQVAVFFGNYSTVPAQITSYTVVYRQLSAQPAPVNLPAGSPIPTLGGAAGRRFNGFIVHLDSLLDNRNVNGYAQTVFYPRVLTSELLAYIGGLAGGIGGTSTIGAGIDCEMIFFGQDHNGHDIKISGILHLDIY